MDPGTIMVLVLMACLAAFLIWIEITGRRNRVNIAPKSSSAQTSGDPPQKAAQNRTSSEPENRKAA
jgi:hypothetical protein